MYIDDMGIRRLRAAIIRQAILDYRQGLKKWKQETRCEEVEQFMRSDWGQWLTDGNGEMFLAAVRKKVYGTEDKAVEVITVTVVCPSGKAQDVADSITACVEQIDGTRVEDVRKGGK